MTYPFKTNFIDLAGDNNVAYIDEGKGKRTLLFIHGLANYAMVWKKNIEFLSQYYRCIAIDLPGNGLSDKFPHPYSMDFYARSIYDFVRQMNLGPLTIVGHSMGGQIAMTAALQYPGIADSLVLCAPAGFEEFSPMDKSLVSGALHLFGYFSSDENGLRQAIENSFYKYQSQGESIIRELSGIMKTYKVNEYRKMVDSSIKSMVDNTLLGQLSKIEQPTLVIFGKRDALIPNKLIHHTTTEKLAQAAVARMPHARLELLPDCGHFVQLERAEDVNNMILKFARQQDEVTEG